MYYEFVLCLTVIVFDLASSSFPDPIELYDSETSEESNLSSLTSVAKYENVFANINTNRKGTIDVVLSEDEGEIGFCHISALIPFSYMDEGVVSLISARGVAGLLLAAQHLNTGDGSVVPALERIQEKCNIRFTVEPSDTKYSEVTAVDYVIDLISRETRRPCVILGSARSAVSIPTAIITGLNGYPQLSYSSTSATLDDKSMFPLFGRVIPSDDGTSIPLIKYLSDKLNVEHFAIVHTNDAYGNKYVTGVLKTAAALAPNMKLFSVEIPFQSTSEDYHRVVSILKQSHYRYFFGIIFDNHYDGLMEEAFRQGIAGTGKHNWIFSDGIKTAKLTNKDYVRDSPLHLTTRGVSVLKAKGSRSGVTAFDKFSDAFKGLNNNESIAYIKSKIPTYSSIFSIDESFFDEPSSYSVFLYDAAILAGLAACDANVIENGTYSYFDGRTHYNSMLNTSFDGSTGTILLNPNTGTRDPDSALFMLFNIVEDEKSSNSSVVKFSTVEAEMFQNKQWIALAPYIFNDGTSNIPFDLPMKIVDMNYIGTPLRAVCLVMSGFVIILSVAFLLWTYKARDTRIVKGSQPFFLYQICYGTILMGSTIIPLSLDDEIVSQNGLGVACMSIPWLFNLGFSTSFAALFSKTSRVNKIFHNPQLRRVKVLPRDVMKPMIFSLSVNILVLSLWTALSPLEWKRENTAFDEFNREIESIGTCRSSSLPLYYFVAPLVFINISGIILALYQAYRARNISTAFAESKYIALVMSTILLVSFIGIPVLFIAYDNHKAFLFVSSSIFFVVCVSLLLLLFLPKIQMERSMQKQGASDNKKRMAQSIRSSMVSSNSSRNIVVSRNSTVSRNSFAKDIESEDVQFLEKQNKDLKLENEKLKLRIKKCTCSTTR